MYLTCILARKVTNKVRQILPYSQSIRIIIFPRKQNWLGAILGTWKLFWTSWPDNALLLGAVEVQAVVTHNEADTKWPPFCRRHFEFILLQFHWHLILRLTVTLSKVHGANMGPIWGRQGTGGPHVGPMNIAIWQVIFWSGDDLAPGRRQAITWDHVDASYDAICCHCAKMNDKYIKDIKKLSFSYIQRPNLIKTHSWWSIRNSVVDIDRG